MNTDQFLAELDRKNILYVKDSNKIIVKGKYVNLDYLKILSEGVTFENDGGVYLHGLANTIIIR